MSSNPGRGSQRHSSRELHGAGGMRQQNRHSGPPHTPASGARPRGDAPGPGPSTSPSTTSRAPTRPTNPNATANVNVQMKTKELKLSYDGKSSNISISTRTLLPPMQREGVQAFGDVLCCQFTATEATVGWEPLPKSRVAAAVHPKRMMKVSFQNLPGSPKEQAATIEALLKAGVEVDGQVFHFMGHSNSQLKSRSCYLYGATPDDIDRILRQLGEFEGIDNVAKRAKRIGLLFTAADFITDIPDTRVEIIPDVEHNGYTFTDGCGHMSKGLARTIANKLNIHFLGERYVPSVCQIRYRGDKGVFALHPAIRASMQVRPSMRKFQSPETTLCVAGCSRPYTLGSLNAQLVVLLHTLGVPIEVLEAKQRQHVAMVRNITRDPETALLFVCTHGDYKLAVDIAEYGLDNPDVRKELRKLQQSEVTRAQKVRRQRDGGTEKEERVRILVEKSRLVYGVCDQTDPPILQYGQWFFQPTVEGRPKVVGKGRVLVHRSPSYHPGDVLVLEPVDVPDLLSPSDLMHFHLHVPTQHWQLHARDTHVALPVVSSALSTFPQTLAVFRASPQLVFALFVRGPLEPNVDHVLDGRAIVFVFAGGQRHNIILAHDHTLHHNENILEVFRGERRRTFVFLKRSMAQGGTARRRYPRQRVALNDVTWELEIASVDLTRFERQNRLGTLRRAPTQSMELYVFSNRHGVATRDYLHLHQSNVPVHTSLANEMPWYEEGQESETGEWVVCVDDGVKEVESAIKAISGVPEGTSTVLGSTLMSLISDGCNKRRPTAAAAALHHALRWALVQVCQVLGHPPVEVYVRVLGCCAHAGYHLQYCSVLADLLEAHLGVLPHVSIIRTALILVVTNPISVLSVYGSIFAPWMESLSVDECMALTLALLRCGQSCPPPLISTHLHQMAQAGKALSFGQTISLLQALVLQCPCAHTAMQWWEMIRPEIYNTPSLVSVPTTNNEVRSNLQVGWVGVVAGTSRLRYGLHLALLATLDAIEATAATQDTLQDTFDDMKTGLGAHPPLTSIRGLHAHLTDPETKKKKTVVTFRPTTTPIPTSFNASPGDIIHLTLKCPTNGPSEGPVLSVECGGIQGGLLAKFEWNPAAILHHSRQWQAHIMGSAVTYKREIAAIKKICEGGSKATELVNVLAATFGHESTPPLPSLALPHLPPPTEGLNMAQQQAVTASLESRLLLVHGPPGSGKTHTIIAMVRARLSVWPTHKILLTAASHAAVDNLLEKLTSLPGITPMRVGDVQRLRPTLALFSLEAQLGGLGPFEASKKARQLLSEATIVLATCAGAGDPLLAGCSFDLVLVDEATQVTEPTVLIPLALSRGALILVGDPCQLPPTTGLLSGAQGLQVSLLERLMQAGWYSVMLDTQYRMHPALCAPGSSKKCISPAGWLTTQFAAFPSAEFYDGKLSTGITARDRPAPSGFPWKDPSRPIAFVQVAGMERSYGTSKANHKEARSVAAILGKILGAGDLVANQIGVVAPYRGQVNALTEMLQTHRGIEVDSVDGFQGREKELIVFSATRCNTLGRVGFLSDRRRLNVMLTRARRGLVVVGDGATLRNDVVWGRWMDWVCAEGLRVTL